MSSFTPSGSGGAPVVNTFSGATTPLIGNVDCLAATETSYALPAGCTQFVVRARGKAIIQFAYIAGVTASQYMTINRFCAYGESELTLPPGVSIYLVTDIADTIEVVSWT